MKDCQLQKCLLETIQSPCSGDLFLIDMWIPFGDFLVYVQVGLLGLSTLLISTRTHTANCAIADSLVHQKKC